MAGTGASSSKAFLFGVIRVVILFAAIGAVTGAGRAVGEVFYAGTLLVSSSSALVSALRDEALRFGVAAAVAGLILAVAAALVRAVLPAGRRATVLGGFVGILRDPRLGPWPYLVIQTVGLGAAAVSFLVAPPSGAFLALCVLCALAGCALFLLSRRFALAFADAKDERLRASLAAFYAGLFYLAAVALLLKRSIPGFKTKVFHLFRNPEAAPAVAALCACTVVVAVLVWLHVFRAARLEKRGGAGLPAGVLPGLVVAAVAVLALASPAVPPPDLAAANPKNVILIGIDTLRYDHTDLVAEKTAAGRDLTPNLRRLARRGTVFTEAISQSSWTLPSFASILTGEYPQEHGAYPLMGELKGRQITLAEVLKAAGYRTGGVVSHFLVGRVRGFNQGFDFFNDEHSWNYRAVTSDIVTDLGIDFLKKNAGKEGKKKPFFLFLHYFDPHYAYRDHEKWTFADSYKGWMRDQGDDYGALQTQRHFLNAADLKYLEDLYDEEIAYTDEQIGRLLDYLAAEHLDGDTAIVVVADHGEEFMERGWIGHTLSLYDELIHVPLVMVLPGMKKEEPVLSEAVETRSIFATILDYLGVDWDGVERSASLVPAIRRSAASGKGRERLSGEAYSAVWIPDAVWGSGKQVKMVSLRTDRWKVVLDRTCRRTSLYDLEKDPGEKKDVSSEHPEVKKKLLKKLEVWAEDFLNSEEGPAQAPSGSQDEIERLKSLGYI